MPTRLALLSGASVEVWLRTNMATGGLARQAALNRPRRVALDAAGNVITQTDPLTHTTRYSYDPLNRLSSVTDPLTRTTAYTYDLAGNLTAVADPLCHST